MTLPIVCVVTNSEETLPKCEALDYDELMTQCSFLSNQKTTCSFANQNSNFDLLTVRSILSRFALRSSTADASLLMSERLILIQ